MEAEPEKLRLAADTPVTLTGEAIFILWDTFGFPRELTQEVAARHGVLIDPAADDEFERLMEEQRERARAAGRFRLSEAESAEAYAALSHLQPRFTGYDTLSPADGRRWHHRRRGSGR